MVLVVLVADRHMMSFDAVLSLSLSPFLTTTIDGHFFSNSAIN